jgi:hypothetical protein
MPSSIQAVILSPGADNPGIHRSGSAIGAFQAISTAHSCKHRKAFVGGQSKFKGISRDVHIQRLEGRQSRESDDYR